MACLKTIGMLEVAALAASTAGNPDAAITLTLLATRSAANWGKR